MTTRLFTALTAVTPEKAVIATAIQCQAHYTESGPLFKWTNEGAVEAMAHLVKDHAFSVELAMNAIKEAAERRGWPR